MRDLPSNQKEWRHIFFYVHNTEPWPIREVPRVKVIPPTVNYDCEQITEDEAVLYFYAKKELEVKDDSGNLVTVPTRWIPGKLTLRCEKSLSALRLSQEFTRCRTPLSPFVLI